MIGLTCSVRGARDNIVIAVQQRTGLGHDVVTAKTVRHATKT